MVTPTHGPAAHPCPGAAPHTLQALTSCQQVGPRQCYLHSAADPPPQGKSWLSGSLLWCCFPELPLLEMDLQQPLLTSAEGSCPLYQVSAQVPVASISFLRGLKYHPPSALPPGMLAVELTLTFVAGMPVSMRLHPGRGRVPRDRTPLYSDLSQGLAGCLAGGGSFRSGWLGAPGLSLALCSSLSLFCQSDPLRRV